MSLFTEDDDINFLKANLAMVTQFVEERSIKEDPIGYINFSSLKIELENIISRKERLEEVLPVCATCIQPEYCRAQAICHYTGTNMTDSSGKQASWWP